MTTLSHGLAPKMRPLNPKRTAVIASLDIGSSKIVCVIARLRPCAPQDVLRRRTHAIEVLGIGHTKARGIKAGTVVDLNKAEEAVRQAVASAERMAGAQVESILLSVSSGRLGSELYAANVDVRDATVVDGDIERVLEAGSHHLVRDGRAVLHSLPVGYALDEVHGIRDPRGMLASRLGVDMNVVTADISALRNLMLCVERAHLAIEAIVAAPYAAAQSVLTDDETDLGAALIDIGAGTTTTSVFVGGHFVHADGFAVGGRHITMDIARGLSARVTDAERIKTLHGSVMSGPADGRDMITIPAMGEDDPEPPQQISKAALAGIIKPRVEEILEMVRDRLAASPFAAEPRARIVLTGGSSQLNGLPELASRILGRQVRTGRPLGLSGLPEAAKGPAFAAVTGLLVYPQTAHLEHFEPRRTRHLATGTDNYFARVGRWLLQSF